MIDFSARVLTMDIQPGQPMREMTHSVYADLMVPVCVGVPVSAPAATLPLDTRQ
jgi:hypothetical protein